MCGRVHARTHGAGLGCGERCSSGRRFELFFLFCFVFSPIAWKLEQYQEFEGVRIMTPRQLPSLTGPKGTDDPAGSAPGSAAKYGGSLLPP